MSNKPKLIECPSSGCRIAVGWYAFQRQVELGNLTPDGEYTKKGLKIRKDRIKKKANQKVTKQEKKAIKKTKK